MIIRRLHPEPGADIDADNENGRNLLAAAYAPPRKRWLRINLIASVNGAAAGDDGTSESLTNRVDRRILGIIRRHSDLVLVGAGTVRAEGYFLPKTAPLAIITGSGDLTGHQIPHDVPAGKVLVLCPATAVSQVSSSLGSTAVTIIKLAPAGDPRHIDISAAVTALHDLGHESIVCEGGPILAGQLINAGLVDEICLSTSPQLSPMNLPTLPGLTSRHSLRLTQLLLDSDDHLFARWMLAN